mmetsp:Transcript_35201/g.34869  ORF Transcript_35201/g.34869 Transcript_35201/m.34869 type:complete len:123 (+) Transcript_35201:90-458(+)
MIIFHILINPYTKSHETSFVNTLHTYLVEGIGNQEDCLQNTECQNLYQVEEYFGLVNHSVLPSLAASALVYPFHYFFVNIRNYSAVISLYIMRVLLGTIMFLSMRFLKVTLVKSLKSTTIAE